jgi:hypothetical protein
MRLRAGLWSAPWRGSVLDLLFFLSTRGIARRLRGQRHEGSAEL